MAADIELHLRDVSQFFHSLDPSPFHDRDLDREAARFIREEFADRPADAETALVVHVPAAQIDRAADVTEAVHRFFGRERQSAELELRELMRFARFALLAGVFAVFVVVALARGLASLAPEGTLTAAVAESLTIVAWVFLWRPAELLLFDRWPIRQRIELLRRLEAVVVRLVGYGAPSPPSGTPYGR